MHKILLVSTITFLSSVPWQIKHSTVLDLGIFQEGHLNVMLSV